MKIIKKYTVIQLQTQNIDNEVKIELTYGTKTGSHYNLQYPKEEHDSEEEAIEWAYNNYKYATYLILPIIRFED